MARVIEERRLHIYECRTDDGGVGLRIGEDGLLLMGYDAGDLYSLLSAIFPDNGNCEDPRDAEPVDGELMEIAAQYLDPARAEERRRWLRDMHRWGYLS